MHEPTIGLEIHTGLKTKSKMFCGCPNNPDEVRANFNVCPVCLGHPGTLPVINRQAVESVLKLGLALGGRISSVSHFDRKSYFYPDLPKGYQISQYKQPLVEGGNLNGVKITRIHLEEDTGTLSHANPKFSGSNSEDNCSLVDFNRAGIPLMELVTEPDIRNAEEAAAFAKELRLILRCLGISGANMEKGEMRIEVNISVSKDDKLGVKVEVKNLNSFKAVEEAIKYEIKRQAEILERGEKIVQETRGWNEAKKETVSQRSKEESHDYRYFPEPDLPPLDLTKLELSRFNLDNLKNEIPELPAEKRMRFEKEYGLTPTQIEILVEDDHIAEYFERAASELKRKTSNVDSEKKYQILFNYLTTDLLGLLNKDGMIISDSKVKPEALAHGSAMVMDGSLSSKMMKDVLLEMHETGLDPHEIAKKRNLSQISDETIIKKTIDEVVAENPAAVQDFKKGKENALQFLIGQAMKKLKGQANPEILKKLFEKHLPH